MSALITKIVVRHVGVLKAFNTPTAPTLAKLTTIYARNGRGKTTLSAILRAAANGDGAILQGRRTLGVTSGDPDVTLISAAGTIRFDGKKWNQKSAPIDVFDGAFITDNLFAGETVELEHDRRLFSVILGHAGVKLARKQEFFNAAAKRTAAALKAAEAAMQDDVPTDMTREEFFAYQPAADIDAKVDAAQKELKSVQQADRLAKLSRLSPAPVPALRGDLADVLAATVESVAASAREDLAAHFTKFHLGKDGESWVKFGLEHIHDDSCPFCGKDGVDERGLVGVYNQIFGDAYKAHFEAIRTAAKQIEETVGPDAHANITQIVGANADAVRAWLEFYPLDASQLTDLKSAIDELTAAHEALKRLFDAKRQSPLEQMRDSEAMAKVGASLASAVTAVNSYNAAVAAIEADITARRNGTQLTEPQAMTRLSNASKRKRRSEPGVQTRIDAVLSAKRADARAKRIRTEVQNRLKKASDDAAKHYYDRVNHYLDKFEATFKISKFSNSMAGNAGSIDYGLLVRGHPVARGRGRGADDEPSFKNTLSTGDKTTLALAFFLSGLDREAKLAERVVVFDDPLSSHDSHRKARTIEFLKGLCGNCVQLIVMSHDEHFLRQVKDRCEGTAHVAYEIKYDGADNWSQAAVVDLDELCRNEYARQVQALVDFYDLRKGDPLHVAPIVRKVLETYYRRTYPAYFRPDQNLGVIVRDIRAQGSSHPCWTAVETLDACNQATMDEHHGDDASLTPAAPIDADNLRGTVRDCLELVHARIPQPAALAATA
jgi:wobble nucleotide-excising tRNase